jgi:hypothetical protein
MQPDLCSEIHMARASNPAAITAGNATLTSQIIDTKGYSANGFIIPTGALTDSLFTCDVYESNDSGMSGETAVVAADLIGQAPAFVITGTAGADSSKVFKVFYKGSKRYIRLKIVQSGATTGGYICSAAIQGKAGILPTT